MKKTSVPPDGGYGWVIVACSFYLTAIGIAGVNIMFSFVLVELITSYDVKKVELTWIGAMQTSIGPLLLCEQK